MRRGRLRFARNQLFGRHGRTFSQPMTGRQYSGHSRPTYTLCTEMRDALTSRTPSLMNKTPSRVSLHGPPPIVVYSEARREVRSGVAIVGNGAVTTSISTFRGGSDRSGRGFPTLQLAPGSPVLLCCDDEGVDRTVAGGNCRTDIGRAVTAFFFGRRRQPELTFGSIARNPA